MQQGQWQNQGQMQQGIMQQGQMQPGMMQNNFFQSQNNEMMQGQMQPGMMGQVMMQNNNNFIPQNNGMVQGQVPQGIMQNNFIPQNNVMMQRQMQPGMMQPPPPIEYKKEGQIYKYFKDVHDGKEFNPNNRNDIETYIAKYMIKDDREFLFKVIDEHWDINDGFIKTIIYILNEDGSEQSVNICKMNNLNERLAYRVQEIAKRTKILKEYHKDNEKELPDKKIESLKKDISTRLSILGKQRREYYEKGEIETDDHKTIIEQLLYLQTIRQLFRLNNDSKYNSYNLGDFDGLNGYDEETGKYYFTCPSIDKNGQIKNQVLYITEEEIEACEGLHCGMENGSYICYCISSLHMLFHTTPMLAILNKIYDEYFDEKGNLKDKCEMLFSGNKGEMIQNLIKVARAYKNKGKKEITENDKYDVLNYNEDHLKDFVINLRQENEWAFIAKITDKDGNFVSYGDPHDAAAGDAKDFINEILMDLQDVLSQRNEQINKQTNEQNIDNQQYNQQNRYQQKKNFMLNELKTNNNFVKQLFCCDTLSTSYCYGCKQTTFKYGINPTIKNENIQTIINNQKIQANEIDIGNIDIYNAKATLFNCDNKNYCQQCKSLQDATQISIDATMPKNILYILDRGPNFIQTPNTKVNMPLVIKELDGKYKVLSSIVIHYGDSSSAGHYANNLFNIDNKGNINLMKLSDNTFVGKIDKLDNDEENKPTPYAIEYKNIGEDLAKKVIKSYQEKIEKNKNNIIETYNFRVNMAFYDKNMNFNDIQKYPCFTEEEFVDAEREIRNVESMEKMNKQQEEEMRKKKEEERKRLEEEQEKKRKEDEEMRKQIWEEERKLKEEQEQQRQREENKDRFSTALTQIIEGTCPDNDLQFIADIMNNNNNMSQTDRQEVLINFKLRNQYPSNWFWDSARERRIRNLHNELDNEQITAEKLKNINSINSGACSWCCSTI